MNFRLQELFFIVLLTVTALMNIADFIGDYREQSPAWHLFQEAFVVIASVGGIAYLLWEVMLRRREIEQIKQQLQQANTRLSASNEKLKGVQQSYREVIQQQLTDWALTPSERDVAMLLLKGLSFEEIAGVWETKEKTVRQQASMIYRKSGLNGRHEFAAWFFEDFLQ
ncbi:helix-turn-helix transcriptional regulator [Leucothrix mucor]|uniref:helix-turn-helix transcriptional regulator n=1 Tax=Leucothrix mucor TaxID=45248 RepID=UPI0003B5ACF7|nr:LuxR C-terminal-related transcriptional regulator [Leucothrix mucor]